MNFSWHTTFALGVACKHTDIHCPKGICACLFTPRSAASIELFHAPYFQYRVPSSSQKQWDWQSRHFIKISPCCVHCYRRGKKKSCEYVVRKKIKNPNQASGYLDNISTPSFCSLAFSLEALFVLCISLCKLLMAPHVFQTLAISQTLWSVIFLRYCNFFSVGFFLRTGFEPQQTAFELH